MLSQLLLMVLDTVFGFVSGILLLRFMMQWLRLPFRNPVGNFVLAASDWLVKPARRVIPGLWGMDLASLVPAWLLQCLLLGLKLAFSLHPASASALPMLLLAGMVETLRLAVYLVIGAVLGVVVLSWVNSHSPLSPLLNGMARPFLRPFQRLIPPVGNVDLSPLVLLLLLQILLFLLDALKGMLLMAAWT
ncbi:MAG: YggT family protein [Rhodocyclaceae bacterium]|nr:YggT family protein [Rhodocyclaceae bacterium]